jgi:RNA polymerase sigma-70 factor (ECF subfamily)
MPGRDRFDGEFDTVLAAARAGEARGVERIFLVLSPVVEGYLRLQGAAEPQDLTSEVFLAVVRNIGSFEGD